jgi:hypothetical protein
MTSERPHFPPPLPSDQVSGPGPATAPAPATAGRPVPQPGIAGAYQPVPDLRKPSAHWALTVTGTLLCFVIGVVGLVFSAQTGTRWRAGDVRGAHAASRLAWWFGVVAVCAFALFLVLGVIAAISDPYYSSY